LIEIKTKYNHVLKTITNDELAKLDDEIDAICKEHKLHRLQVMNMILNVGKTPSFSIENDSVILSNDAVSNHQITGHVEFTDCD